MNYIYLHGFASSPKSYKGSYIQQRFAEIGKTLHCPDLNGADFEHLTISSQLSIIRELADSLSGEITLIGSSLGGYLAALFAEDEQRVSRLVMMCPAFQFASRYAKRMPPETLEKWRNDGFIELYHFGYKTSKRLHFGVIEDAAPHDNRELQRRLPALIIHGLRDEVVPYSLSVDYLEGQPQAQLLLLNADHGMADAVDLIWQQIKLFLDI
ncbi:MAG: alpha/beta fold hydrolase [Calditrichae bacterium]|nr:alpha/beta fold hydrolase [Calditrichia bacterium]